MSETPSASNSNSNPNANPESTASPELPVSLATPTRREPARITKRHCVIGGIVAALADIALLSRAGAPAQSLLLGGAFVGVFVGGGMWLMQKRRDRRSAQERADRLPELREVQRPTPGGWANPTKAQRVRQRIRQMSDLLPTRRAGRKYRSRR